MGADVVFAVDCHSYPAKSWKSRQGLCYSIPERLVNRVATSQDRHLIVHGILRPGRCRIQRTISGTNQIGSNPLLLKANLRERGRRCRSCVAEEGLDLLIRSVARAIQGAAATAAPWRESRDTLELLLI